MTVMWATRPFEDCIERIIYTTKIRRKDYLDSGAYPIVSQEEEFVNGYWNNEADVLRLDRPAVIFGDHTRILKYVNFDFVLGADGVKVLKPKPFLHPRFFYYQLHTAKLDSLGYARHYRLLKDFDVAFPEISEQQRIVAILDDAFDGIAKARDNAEQILRNARELFESAREAALRPSASWVERAFSEICEIKHGFAFKSEFFATRGEHVLLTPGNFRLVSKICGRASAQVACQAHDIARFLSP